MSSQREFGLKSTAPAWALAVTAMLAIPSPAKPIHFESLKEELIARSIRCTDCHVTHDGPEMTAYGQHLAAMGKDESVRERVRRMEEELPLTASDDDRTRESGRQDVDGDGIANWVEILAQTNPSEANPVNDLHERIQRVISCHLCHTTVNRFPIPGKDRAPHNKYGESLRKAGERFSGSAAARKKWKESGKSRPIMPRIIKAEKRDTDGDQVSDWQEIITYHHPAEKADEPTLAEIAAALKAHRIRKTQQEGYGDAHP